MASILLPYQIATSFFVCLLKMIKKMKGKKEREEDKTERNLFSRRNSHFLIAAKPERRSRQPQNSGQLDEIVQEHSDFAENWEKLL